MCSYFSYTLYPTRNYWYQPMTVKTLEKAKTILENEERRARFKLIELNEKLAKLNVRELHEFLEWHFVDIGRMSALLNLVHELLEELEYGNFAELKDLRDYLTRIVARPRNESSSQSHRMMGGCDDYVAKELYKKLFGSF